jgi:hypothetical protein
MLKRVLVLLVSLVGWTVSLGGTAGAQSCRSLQLQMNMAQASRDPGEYQRVYRRMAGSGCFAGQSRSLPEVRRPRERARATTRQAKPRESARATRRKAKPRRYKRKQPGIAVARSTYRTLCVRSCDGYYFTLANRDGQFVPRYVGPVGAATSGDATQSAIRLVGAEELNPVLVSPVPNDFDTSFIWNPPDTSPLETP